MQNNRNINTYEIDSIKKIKTISCKARHIRNTISYACKCFWKKLKVSRGWISYVGQTYLLKGEMLLEFVDLKWC
jgi:hypothetical protein